MFEHFKLSVLGSLVGAVIVICLLEFGFDLPLAPWAFLVAFVWFVSGIVLPVPSKKVSELVAKDAGREYREPYRAAVFFCGATGPICLLVVMGLLLLFSFVGFCLSFGRVHA